VNLVPAIMGRRVSAGPTLLPEAIAGAEQVVLLVIDGLGARLLEGRAALAPALSQMERRVITSVAPSTTAVALTSLATGLAPCEHGVVGYRVVEGEGVMNLLRWSIDGRPAAEVEPASYQPHLAFLGRPVPVVSRVEFEGTPFTEMHLRAGVLQGWSVPSSMPLEISSALRRGADLVYAYYDGLDKVAHRHGLDEHLDQELAYVDHLVTELLERLPRGAALAIVADHGMLEVPHQGVISLGPILGDAVTGYSGEGRFRFVHCEERDAEDLVARLRDELGERAWVLGRDELVANGIYGGPLSVRHRARLGEVAVIARGAVAFSDPADPKEGRLLGRHGSLSDDEMLVPLLGWRA
jgi:Type I phosphodiesterase / nucleotide pyrophosphatase